MTDFFPSDTLAAPECKALGADGGAAGLARAFEDFSRNFAAWREASEERLQQIERRQADVLADERLARIEAALDESQRRHERARLAAMRPPLAPDGGGDALAGEHKSAFHAYVRAGETAGLKLLETRALSAGSGPDGGYLAPADVERDVLGRLAVLSPVRAIASVRAISAGVYRKAVSVSGAAAGWVSETAARPQTASPTLAELTFPAMELYAQPAATQTLLDDAVVDIDRWLAEEVEQAFAAQESQAFVSGDGVAQPLGFLSAPTVANSSWTWGKLGFVATGATGAFPATDPGDVLIELIHALRAPYRQNAVFVLNRRTQSLIRRFKNSDGGYLWAPPATAAAGASLLGFPVVEVEDMPDVAAGSFSVAFGDFRRGYLVVDRTGLRVLRDPYSAKPYVLFYTTKRVGGGVQDYDAIKLLKFSA
ncbi:phage major capsid protein [Camelimonas abortus]|uniref:Phage major capsid protein n=1 Tax=Camelimonas abortus TaxID=1017184 RepID=A0ABV7LFV6_9HYPH